MLCARCRQSHQRGRFGQSPWPRAEVTRVEEPDSISDLAPPSWPAENDKAHRGRVTEASDSSLDPPPPGCPQEHPEVFREIKIASDKKLADLAKAIVSAFDFQFDHAFGFYSKLTGPEVMRAQPKYELFDDMGERDTSGSVKRTRVAEAFPEVGHTMLFLFDYGDDWRFIVEVIGRGEREPKVRYPRMLRRKHVPEQYPEWDDDTEEYEDEDQPVRPH